MIRFIYLLGLKRKVIRVVEEFLPNVSETSCFLDCY